MRYIAYCILNPKLCVVNLKTTYCNIPIFQILIDSWNILGFPKLFPKTTSEDLTKMTF